MSILSAPSKLAQTRPAEIRRRVRLTKRLSTLIVIAVLVIQTYPLLWVVMTALRTPADFAGGSRFALPSEWTLDNFSRAFAQSDLLQYFANSAIVTVASILLIVALTMMAGYAIAILRFRFSQGLLAFFLIGIIVPVQVALIPLFITYTNVGLLNTHISLIVPMVAFALPVSLYMFVSFMRFIPTEILEAAALDGCNAYQAFFRVVIPMSKNTIVTVVFINAVFIWNDFIFANTFILSGDLKTVPLGLQDFIGAMGATDWTATFAAVTVTVTPLLLMFLALSKAIIYGLEAGAAKG